MKFIALISAFFVLSSGSYYKNKGHLNTLKNKIVKVSLDSKSGSSVTGLAVFIQKKSKVVFKIELHGLQPNTTHAIHLHEKADCSSHDGTSTGGHWNPTAQPHGKWGVASGYHRGDIGNVVSDSKGNASLSMETDVWCLDCSDDAKNVMGKAIIVHAGSDDYATQPTGNAGGRVSCGAIIK